MRRIVRLLFRFESEYSGSPLLISGNALRHALSMRVNTSMGIFSDIRRLIPPASYQEFFLIRTKKCFLPPYYEAWWNKRIHQRSYRCFFTPQFVTFDLINPPKDIIETIQSKELLQVGGRRNLGFGSVMLRDYLEIDIDSFKMPEQASHLTLLSPVIYLPSFAERYNCRHKTINMWNHNKVNPVRIIAPGQFFRIKQGKIISKIAKKGILRRGLFGQFGFGEFIIHSWTQNCEGS